MARTSHRQQVENLVNLMNSKPLFRQDQVGEQVTHDSLGIGIIAAVNGVLVDVSFQGQKPISILDGRLSLS